MNQFLRLILMVLLVGCTTASNKKPIIINSEFLKIVEMYMKEFSEIPNSCNHKPYYEISFTTKGSDIGFLIAAYLGKPGAVPPLEPGTKLIENPMVIKGTALINNKPVVFYDYKNSDGYGLYNASLVSIDNLMNFKSIHDSCGNVWYPEAWCYTVTKDSIFMTEKRKAFQLK